MNNSNNQFELSQDLIEYKLSISDLRKYSGCEHYSDEEAEEITGTLYQLAIFLFNGPLMYMNGNNSENLKQAA